MTRTSQAPHPATSRDWPFRVLVTALFAVAVWLLAMPWCPPIAKCTMDRFHLRTSSFPAWAIQQPIPPMYSFANTTEVHTQQPRTTAIPASEQRQTEQASGSGKMIAGRTINHFPTREFTFANARVRYLSDRSSKWFVLRSVYRGQSLETVYRLDPLADRGWSVTLLEDSELALENES